MTVLRNDNRWDRSNVVFRDGRLLRYDKRQPTSGDDAHRLRRGACCGGKRSSASRRTGPRPGRPYGALVAEGRMVGYEVTRRFYEIGSPRGLEETQAYLASSVSGPRAAVSDPPLTASPRMSVAWRLRSSHTRRLTWRRRRQILDRLDRTADRPHGGAARRRCASAAGGCSSSASAAAPPTPRTPSTTSARSPSIEAYAPTDNVSELTARTNDEGWETVFVAVAGGSRLAARDMVFVLSVGGGDLERNISPNLVRRCSTPSEVGADDLRHRRPRRRLHGQGRRRLRHRADGQPGDRDAARRGVPGGRLAPVGLASGTEGDRDEVGIESGRGLQQPGTVDRRVAEVAQSSGTVRCQARPAVFLDRDGVLNRAFVRDGVPHPPAHRTSSSCSPGCRRHCGAWRTAGFALVVVTNQPDVARGIADPRARRGDERPPARAACRCSTC